jgi:hypothetical protein
MKKRFKAILPDGIKAKSIDLTKFNTNPVILLNHDYNEVPIGRATDVKVSNRGMYFTPSFHKINEASEKIAFLSKEGMITKGYPGGYIETDENNNVTKFDIYEISICP